MARKIDLSALRKKAVQDVREATKLYDNTASLEYWNHAWIAKMTAVEVHAIWERYAETRLVAALNHNPKHFISEEGIVGLAGVSVALARYIVRGGRAYFDVRSTDDLIGKANKWLGNTANPFASLTLSDRAYIDCLTAIRNCVVHGSETSVTGYKRSIRKVYGLVKAPTDPAEFLHAKDPRASCPAPNKARLHGLVDVIAKVIQKT